MATPKKGTTVTPPLDANPATETDSESEITTERIDASLARVRRMSRVVEHNLRLGLLHDIPEDEVTDDE